jgi:hypothetical protein
LTGYLLSLEYFIFFSIDSSEARKQYDEFCLSIMQTITYAHDRTHSQDPTPQGVENRNILLWFKSVLTALHVNCMILFDKVL